jgi:hypothetical protein
MYLVVVDVLCKPDFISLSFSRPYMTQGRLISLLLYRSVNVKKLFYASAIGYE